MDSMINNIAIDVLSIKHNLKPGEVQAQLDPATIMLIVSLIKALVGTYKACKEQNEAPDIKAEPSKIEIKIIKREIRRKLGWRRNIREGKSYFNALVERRKELTKKEVSWLNNEPYWV